MAYQATPIEWLALGAVAQQPGETIRSYPFRLYLKECVGVPHPLRLITSMLKGGLIESADSRDHYHLTEWGAQCQRARVETRLPWFIEVPEPILEAKMQTR